MNNKFKNKRTKKNKDKLKWNYRKIIISIKHIVKHNNNLTKSQKARAKKAKKIIKLKRKER